MLSNSQTLVTGVYRTGSEYVAHLINCHPQVSATMYHVNVMRFAYGRYDPISARKNYLEAVQYLKDRMANRYNIGFNVETVVDYLESLDRVGYGDIYDTVMSVLYLKPGQEHWAEKCQLVWREIPAFLEMMGNGRAVLILRDPRAVLASFKYFTNAPPPKYLGAVFNCLDAMGNAMKLSEEERVVVVKYEDVLIDPQKNISKIWRLMGVPDDYDLKLCDTRKWKNSQGKQWGSNSSFQVVNDQSSFDVNKAVGGWKEKLSSNEIAFVEMICGEAMGRYGYEVSRTDGDTANIERGLENDEGMYSVYKQYLETGKGIEAFPSDPFDATSWATLR